MAKVWVLDTDTKGTGAQMVPLERTLKRPAPKERILPRRGRRERSRQPPARPDSETGPRRFKVVNALTGEVVAENEDARTAVDASKGARSLVDFRVYVWDRESEDWRALTLAEQRALLGLRDR